LSDLLEAYSSLDSGGLRQISINKFGSVSMRHFLQILAGFELDPKPNHALESISLAHGAQLQRAASLVQTILQKVNHCLRQFLVPCTRKFFFQIEEEVDQSSISLKKRVPTSLYDLSYNESGALLVQLMLSIASKLANSQLFGSL
jgi:hypothetical protein